MKSGSKRGAKDAELAELAAWQRRVLDAFASSPLARAGTFGGATALSAVYFHHRRSFDLDFFFREPVEPLAIAPIGRAVGRGVSAEVRVTGVRTMLVLVARGKEIGHVDFAWYPYDPVDRETRWRGLRVDSLTDMAVNKVQAVLTRCRDRDFVDLYFLLREGREPELTRLLALARAKFDVGASRMTLAESLLRVEDVTELPQMIRPLPLDELKRFFVDQARALVRSGP